MGGFRGIKKKSQGNVMNCPETTKKIVDPPHSEKIDKLLFTPPPPLPNRWGGGLGVKIGGTDGREGLMGGREGCDGNYEVDPVHMAWNGCILLIGNPSEAG